VSRKQGYCKRGENCWFKHIKDSKSQRNGKGNDSDSDSDSYDCSICLETPVTYGLLGGCGHIFCVSVSLVASLTTPSETVSSVSGNGGIQTPRLRTSTWLSQGIIRSVRCAVPLRISLPHPPSSRSTVLQRRRPSSPSTGRAWPEFHVGISKGRERARRRCAPSERTASTSTRTRTGRRISSRKARMYG